MILLSLQGCMGGPKLYFQSLDFDLRESNPDIEVLNYQYCISENDCFRMSRGYVGRGAGIQQSHYAGPMPRGTSWYVKWRVKPTGAVYEERIDLANRLPEDVTDGSFTFRFVDSRLHVYLSLPDKEWRPDPSRQEPVNRYLHLKQYEIYPAQPQWQSPLPADAAGDAHRPGGEGVRP